MAFYTLNNKTQTINVTNSSVATALAETADVAPGRMNVNYEIQNGGAVPVFMAYGSSTVSTTATTGYPILPGQSKVIDIPNNTDASKITHFAFIAGTTGQTVYITPGYGQ